MLPEGDTSGTNNFLYKTTHYNKPYHVHNRSKLPSTPLLIVFLLQRERTKCHVGNSRQRHPYSSTEFRLGDGPQNKR